MDTWEWNLRSEISKALEPFQYYGLQDYTPSAVKELIIIFKKYSKRMAEEE